MDILKATLLDSLKSEAIHQKDVYKKEQAKEAVKFLQNVNCNRIPISTMDYIVSYYVKYLTGDFDPLEEDLYNEPEQEYYDDTEYEEEDDYYPEGLFTRTVKKIFKVNKDKEC